MWSAALSDSGFLIVDVASALADLLSVKDENEIINVKKAAFMTASVMKSSTVPRLEGKCPCFSNCKLQHMYLTIATTKQLLLSRPTTCASLQLLQVCFWYPIHIHMYA